jgi:hypothetical protein
MQTIRSSSSRSKGQLFDARSISQAVKVHLASASSTFETTSSDEEKEQRQNDRTVGFAGGKIPEDFWDMSLIRVGKVEHYLPALSATTAIATAAKSAGGLATATADSMTLSSARSESCVMTQIRHGTKIQSLHGRLRTIISAKDGVPYTVFGNVSEGTAIEEDWEQLLDERYIRVMAELETEGCTCKCELLQYDSGSNDHKGKSASAERMEVDTINVTESSDSHEPARETAMSKCDRTRLEFAGLVADWEVSRPLPGMEWANGVMMPHMGMMSSVEGSSILVFRKVMV